MRYMRVPVVADRVAVVYPAPVPPDGLPTATMLAIASSWALAARPNFLILFVDDMGINQLNLDDPRLHGYTGDNGTIETPNIKRLAREGMTFQSWYSSFHVRHRSSATTPPSPLLPHRHLLPPPLLLLLRHRHLHHLPLPRLRHHNHHVLRQVCSPSRSSMMTGRLSVRGGADGTGPDMYAAYAGSTNVDPGAVGRAAGVLGAPVDAVVFGAGLWLQWPTPFAPALHAWTSYAGFVGYETTLQQAVAQYARDAPGSVILAATTHSQC